MLSTRDLMEKLISFQPVSADVAAVNALVDFLDDYITEQGAHTAVEELGSRKILYASTSPGRESRVLLNSHLDVVPADASMFAVVEDGDWLCGRGTHDCLGNSAILANLLRRLTAEDDIGVIFSTDEEIGGETTKTMVERGCRGRELVMVADGSGNSLVIAQKGVLSVTARARGTGCHAAKPWEGVNAIDKLIAGYLRIKEMFPEVAPPDEWRDTIAATTFAAGNVHNRVPETAEMTLNIRTTENTDQGQLLARMNEVSGLEIEANMQCPPVFCPPDDPVLVDLKDYMQGFLGRDIAVKRSNGATDARHFVGMGIPIAIVGAPGRDLHGDGEAVSAAGLRDYEEMLAGFLGAGRAQSAFSSTRER